MAETVRLDLAACVSAEDCILPLLPTAWSGSLIYLTKRILKDGLTSRHERCPKSDLDEKPAVAAAGQHSGVDSSPECMVLLRRVLSCLTVRKRSHGLSHQPHLTKIIRRHTLGLLLVALQMIQTAVEFIQKSLVQILSFYCPLIFGPFAIARPESRCVVPSVRAAVHRCLHLVAPGRGFAPGPAPTQECRQAQRDP